MHQVKSLLATMNIDDLICSCDVMWCLFFLLHKGWMQCVFYIRDSFLLAKVDLDQHCCWFLQKVAYKTALQLFWLTMNACQCIKDSFWWSR